MSALRGDLQAHSGYQHSGYRGKVEPCCITSRAGQKYICNPHSASFDMSKPSNSANNKLTLGDYITDRCLPQPKQQVGEPMESKMKYIQSYFESDVTVRSSTLNGDAMESYELKMGNNSPSGFHLDEETCRHSKDLVDLETETCSNLTGTKKPSNDSTASCDSCSSYLDEGDSSRSSSLNPQITEPLSTLNFDNASQKSKQREASQLLQIEAHRCEEVVLDKKHISQANDKAFSLFHSMQRDVPTKQDPMQTRPNASVEKTLNIDISQANDKAFSLFHFGGPFALADAYKSSDSLLDDAVGGLSLTKSIYDSGSHLTKDFIQEYNLFASCKGITFPIF